MRISLVFFLDLSIKVSVNTGGKIFILPGSISRFESIFSEEFKFIGDETILIESAIRRSSWRYCLMFDAENMAEWWADGELLFEQKSAKALDPLSLLVGVLHRLSRTTGRFLMSSNVRFFLILACLLLKRESKFSLKDLAFWHSS